MRKSIKNPSGTKHLIFTITVLSIIILICCNPSPHHHIRLPVPYESQWYNGWCGAACIQMWAEYDGRYPGQDEIASFIGWTGTNPPAIANGVGFYTNETGVDWYYGSSEYEQDLALSSQVVSVKDNIPSISIVNNGYHAVIVIGFDWTDTVNGPRADGVSFHDPLPYNGPSLYISAGDWKQNWFTAYNGQHVIILGYAWHVSEGEMGYIEFLNQGGTYYGGPKDYEPMH